MLLAPLCASLACPVCGYTSSTPRPLLAGLENDQYVRQIDGYLPTAEVAFIDEIFKVGGGGRGQQAT